MGGDRGSDNGRRELAYAGSNGDDGQTRKVRGYVARQSVVIAVCTLFSAGCVHMDTTRVFYEEFSHCVITARNIFVYI